MLYDCKNLIDRCEQVICLHSNLVLSTNGFIECYLETLLNILRFDSLNCKEMVVFEACIEWAKNHCANNGMDASDHKHLRQTLDSALYQIRFGTMTVEEFMRCYQSYKNIFTEDEREQILYAIGKVADPKSYHFNDESRDIQYGKWDENSCIKCWRVFSKFTATMSETFLYGLTQTTFSCNQSILLGAIYFGALAEKPGLWSPCDKCVTAEVVIIRKRQLNDAVGKTIFTKTERFTFTTNQQTVFEFEQAIKIRPNFLYEIRVHFKDGFYMKLYEFKKLINLDTYKSQTIIDFHGTEGAVTGFVVNTCKKEGVVDDVPGTPLPELGFSLISFERFKAM